MIQPKNFLKVPGFLKGNARSKLILISALILVGLSIASTIIYVQATQGNITESTSINTQYATFTTTSTIVSGSVTAYTVVTQTNEVVLHPEISWSNTTYTSIVSTSDGTVTLTNTSETTTTLTLSTCTVNFNC